ncbi:MAG: oxidoreductase [Actinomycetes bacterium]|nr:MAG: oxidoreductase [Actinomycetes bacterium]
MAVVGLGYWGPNRLRVINDLHEAEVGWICDLEPARLAHHAERNPLARATADIDEPLADPAVDAVIIATPVFAHEELATKALEAGKHVFVEKPLAASCSQAAGLVELAERRDLVLACGHTFLHSPPVQAAKAMIDAGDLGAIHYVSSSRVNLGPYRSDVSAIFDLGPHDFSILRYWIERNPATVSAIGLDAISPGVADVAFVHLDFRDDLIAHVELSWLAPSKLRRTVIIGSEKMLVYEDGSPEPLRLYDSGIEYRDPETFGEYQLSYRTGDIVSLRVEATEPIAAELRDFTGSVIDGHQPLANGEVAVDVLRTVEAAEASMTRDGEVVRVEASQVGDPAR